MINLNLFIALQNVHWKWKCVPLNKQNCFRLHSLSWVPIDWRWNSRKIHQNIFQGEFKTLKNILGASKTHETNIANYWVLHIVFIFRPFITLFLKHEKTQIFDLTWSSASWLRFVHWDNPYFGWIYMNGRPNHLIFPVNDSQAIIWEIC